MSFRLPSPSEYTSKLAGSLNDLRKENQLCDIIINVGGRAFHAHKNVLAARSSYFLAMFTSGFREATQGEVNIDCGKSMIFELLLDYVYTGKLDISGETAYDLLEMACFMQLTDLSRYCSKFIQLQYDLSSDTDEKIAMGDVYKIYEMARLHGHLESLAEESQKHMCTYFQKLKSLDVLVQEASVEFLEKFLSQPDIASKDEEKEVLEFVVNWLKHDWEKRRSFAASLLNKVRLGLIPEQNLTELLDGDILEIPECKQLLQELHQRRCSKDSAYRLSQRFPEMFRTRSTITVPIAISAPEGEDTLYSSFYYYNTKQSQWSLIRSMNDDLHHLPSLIVVNDTLYAVGGAEEEFVKERWSDSDSYNSDGSSKYLYETECKNDFQRYDAEEDDWVSLPPLRVAYKEKRLVYMNGCIYAIGGKTDDKTGHSDCEYYDIAEGKWNTIASLPGRYNCWSATTYQGSILVCGYSLVLENAYYLESQEKILIYNSSIDEWQSVLKKPKESALSEYTTKSVLFVHRDQCYSVAYSLGVLGQNKSVVQSLSLSSSGSEAVSTVTLGEEIKQDFIPTNKEGAFRIGEEVFITTDGVAGRVVHLTDLKIYKDQDTDIDLGKWENFAKLKRRSNIVKFTCDYKDNGNERMNNLVSTLMSGSR